jgi:hypothetical protein
MIHNLKQNGATAPSIAEQRAAAYRAESLPSKPTAARKPDLWRAWLVAGALAGGLTAAGLGYALVPAVPSTAVRQVFVDVDGNGTLDLLLYGEVVLNSGPLAQSGQP